MGRGSPQRGRNPLSDSSRYKRGIDMMPKEIGRLTGNSRSVELESLCITCCIMCGKEVGIYHDALTENEFLETGICPECQ